MTLGHRSSWLLACALSGLAASCSSAPEEETEAPAEEEVAHEGEIHLSEEAIRRAQITLGAVEAQEIGGGTSVPAEVQADPARTAHVASLVDGRVRQIDVQLGARVAVGQLLAVIDSVDAAQISSALGEARARYELAEAAVTRYEALTEGGVGAQRSLLEAQAERDEQRATLDGLNRSRGVLGSRRGGGVPLIAPLDGIVTAMHAVVGETLPAGEMAFTISDLTHLWVVGHVPELAVEGVHEGQPARLRLHAFPSRRWAGTISFIAPTIEATTRTLEVRVELVDDGTLLRPGMFGALDVVLDPRSDGDAIPPQTLVIPASAPTQLGGVDVVFVPGDEAGAFRPVPVELGRRDGDLVHVRSGLALGDVVVASGAFTLKSEMLRDQLAAEE